jgi:F-type H+-transporting ATPase subunit delta
MSEFRVSSRYAKSLLELAIEKNVLENVHQDMKMLSSVIANNNDFAQVLKSPIIKSDKKSKVIKAIFEGKSDAMTLAFYDILARKNRADLLIDIAREFQKQYNQFKGIQVAEITTTFPLTSDLRDQFTSTVKEISGKSHVELVEKVDDKIIGGFILKINDRQLDQSISSKLRNLRLQFSHNEFEKKY